MPKTLGQNVRRGRASSVPAERGEADDSRYAPGHMCALVSLPALKYYNHGSVDRDAESR